jgi:hypothetical protein
MRRTPERSKEDVLTTSASSAKGILLRGLEKVAPNPDIEPLTPSPFFGDAMGRPGSQAVLSSLRAPFRAMGEAILPSPDSLDEEGWVEAERIVEDALASKPSGIKRQIRLFLRLVDLLPIVTSGRTFSKLSVPRRAAFLHRLHRSPIMPLRKGLWGIRTLIFMGYYNQAGVRDRIGYGADPWGWTAHFGEQLAKERDRS